MPRRTVRLRLSLLYGSLFLAVGAVLLVLTDFLWGRATSTSSSTLSLSNGPFATILRSLAPPWATRASAVISPTPGPNFRVVGPGFQLVTRANIRQQSLVAGQLHVIATQQHSTDLHLLLLFSAIALAVMAIIAIVIGWLMAGRFLRPLRTITATARDISVSNLHERLGLEGPDDELKELGDTFDRLLGRLEGSFESQRQFVANASHELRTPLTTMRASLDVAVAKPGPVPEETVTLVGRLRDELDQVDRLLESFLSLARAQRGPDADEQMVSLGELAASAIGEHAVAIADKQLTVDEQDDPRALVTGSGTLFSRMVGNLVDNAIKHNVQGGWVHLRTEVDGVFARLVVESGGAVLDEDSVQALSEPFRRLAPDRTGSETGTGLGLSIVAAVAQAHGGRLELHALSDGGLQASIELPLALDDFVGATT
ncbi:MAG: HAMP domain-containing sensor histidine kinase [Acidimicrobiales bacterium]